MVATTFNYTGGAVLYTVPAGYTYVTIEAYGAEGGPGATGIGGKGGFARGKLIAAAGTVLTVRVGGKGGTGGVSVGGFNGGGGGGTFGGYDGSGGGGASDVRNAAGTRLLSAGGGGGCGGGPGGNGGNGGGTTGSGGGYGPGGGDGGKAGSATVGESFTGGGGGAGPVGGGCGGGGGGGFRGGGGGGYGTSGGGGGGGGSGAIDGTLYNPGMLVAERLGHGQVTITATNVAPLAPTLTGPANNGYSVASLATLLTWKFNDSDLGDSQSRADVRHKVAGGATWTTVANAAAAGESYTVPANTWVAGTQIEWQVASWDAAGLAGPFSASRFTNVIASVTPPTITAPPTSSDQFATPVTLTWTLPATFTQNAYQVQRASTADGLATVYYDSGTVVTVSQSAAVPLDAAAGRTDYLRVRFRYESVWSDWQNRPIVGQFGPPAPSLLVCTQRAGEPVVDIQITSPPASLGFAATLLTDLYRDGVKIAANLPNDSSFTDLLPTAGVVVYSAVAFAASGASSSSY